MGIPVSPEMLHKDILIRILPIPKFSCVISRVFKL